MLFSSQILYAFIVSFLTAQLTSVTCIVAWLTQNSQLCSTRKSCSLPGGEFQFQFDVLR